MPNYVACLLIVAGGQRITGTNVSNKGEVHYVQLPH